MKLKSGDKCCSPLEGGAMGFELGGGGSFDIIS